MKIFRKIFPAVLSLVFIFCLAGVFFVADGESAGSSPVISGAPTVTGSPSSGAGVGSSAGKIDGTSNPGAGVGPKAGVINGSIGPTGQKISGAGIVKAPVAPSAPSLDSGGSRISGLIARFSYWLTLLVYIVISLALVFFLWGVVKYVLSGGDEEKRQQGRNFIVYGIIGLFVMVAVWGLVYLVGSIIGVKPGGGVDLPQLPGGNFAAGSSGSKLITIINLIGGWVSSIVLVLIGLAFLFFLWGVANYIGSGADEEKRTEAKRFVAFGIAGLFVMVAVWGLVYLVGATVGIKPGGGASTVPQIETVKINDVVDPTTGKVLISGGSADSTAFSSCDGYTWPENKSFKSIVCLVLKVLNPIPPILVALAMLYFFWGVAKYIKAGGDAEEMRKGRSTIVYGILALFIIVAVWGVVAVFKNELGL